MKTKLQHFCILLALLAGIHQAAAQGTTAFTYQGQLHDGGTNANGTYTMEFKLYDASGGGTQIGSTLTTSPTLANGLFTVNLDFGNAFNGSARWLDITVQSGSDIETLTPRVQMLPTPYAQFAAVAGTVTNGAILNAQLAANAVATANIQNNSVTNRNLTANAVNATNIASGQVVKGLNGLSDMVSLLAGTNLVLTTNGNVLQISSLNGAAVPNGIQVFISGGTFTVPAGITRIQVEAWGGGGGGGGSIFFHQEDGGGNTTNVAQYGGGGGGSGGYALGIFNVTPGSSYPVTIGGSGSGGMGYTESLPNPAQAGTAGTSSSFGGLLIAYGGIGGGGATASVNGAGGSKPAPASGSLLPAAIGNGGNDGLNYGPPLGSGSTLSIGGQGGSAFRGGNGALGGPAGGVPYGRSGDIGHGGDGSLGAGGGGGGMGNPGGDGGGGAVFITY